MKAKYRPATYQDYVYIELGADELTLWVTADISYPEPENNYPGGIDFTHAYICKNVKGKDVPTEIDLLPFIGKDTLTLWEENAWDDLDDEGYDDN